MKSHTSSKYKLLRWSDILRALFLVISRHKHDRWKRTSEKKKMLFCNIPEICQWVINVISRDYARLAPFVPIQDESLWNWNGILLISYHAGWLVLRLFLIRIWKYNLSITITFCISLGKHLPYGLNAVLGMLRSRLTPFFLTTQVMFLKTYLSSYIYIQHCNAIRYIYIYAITTTTL